MPTCKFHHFRPSMDMSLMENGLKHFFIDCNLSFSGGSNTFFKKIIVKKMLSVKLISNAEDWKSCDIGSSVLFICARNIIEPVEEVLLP